MSCTLSDISNRWIRSSVEVPLFFWDLWHQRCFQVLKIYFKFKAVLHCLLTTFDWVFLRTEIHWSHNNVEDPFMLLTLSNRIGPLDVYAVLYRQKTIIETWMLRMFHIDVHCFACLSSKDAVLLLQLNSRRFIGHPCSASCPSFLCLDSSNSFNNNFNSFSNKSFNNY